MEQFPHLKFVQKITGKPRLSGGGGPNPQTEANKRDRASHSGKLQRWVTNLKSNWNNSFVQREQNGFAPLNEEVIPIYIQVNPDIINTIFDLSALGIEIISEEEDGYILGASLDNFRSLEEKIRGFVDSKFGTGRIADFWSIVNGNREEWKPKHVLSEELYIKWAEIRDDQIYGVEVSIAFDKPLNAEPDASKQGGQRRLEKYREKLIERDEKMLERQNHFDSFIHHYGERLSSFVEFEDGFGCEVSITGKGLKDLVVNYQFVFEVVEMETVSGGESGEDEFSESEIQIIPPDAESIEVGVIDSGIMEGNKYIKDAIKTQFSRSYLIVDSSTSDEVTRGGHGTKVAGAILYPNGISTVSSPYKLPCFIRNIRVLDSSNRLQHKYPAELMQDIVNDNDSCQLYNLSISSHAPYRTRHMSIWATMIDKLIHEKEVLFIVAVGNVNYDAIKYYLSNSNLYPNYLKESYCRLANPSQSSFALSVGSINHAAFSDNDWTSIGNPEEISAYSRIGTGIWGHIKPDVVEYGGGIVVSKNGMNLVREHKQTATELIRSTLNGGLAIGKDSSGTSFSTPKVTHIVAMLKNLYPNEGVNILRAFVAQGARLPGHHFFNPSIDSIRHFGYGLPSLERVTRNTDYRITFYNIGKTQAEQAHLYCLNIPSELRGQGDEYDVLIEVSLAYTGRVRRTRQKTKSYLSTWLDWTVSRLDEGFNEFSERSLVLTETDEEANSDEEGDSSQVIQWKIRERSNWGSVKDINRNNSTLQKDWAILKSFQLPEEICFAVRGHKGWDKNKNEVPYAITVSIEILGADIPIYELIKVENQVEIESQV
jgi:hypothetical protein